MCVYVEFTLLPSPWLTQNSFKSAHREHKKSWTHASTNLLGSSSILNGSGNVIFVDSNRCRKTSVLNYSDLELSMAESWLINEYTAGPNYIDLYSSICFLWIRACWSVSYNPFGLVCWSLLDLCQWFWRFYTPDIAFWVHLPSRTGHDLVRWPWHCRRRWPYPYNIFHGSWPAHRKAHLTRTRLQRGTSSGWTGPTYQPLEWSGSGSRTLQESSTWVSNNGVWCIMMTSSNGNIFRVSGPLCGEFTGQRWIPCTKASDAEILCFLWSAPE